MRKRSSETGEKWKDEILLADVKSYIPERQLSDTEGTEARKMSPKYLVFELKQAKDTRASL